MGTDVFVFCGFPAHVALHGVFGKVERVQGTACPHQHGNLPRDASGTGDLDGRTGHAVPGVLMRTG